MCRILVLAGLYVTGLHAQVQWMDNGFKASSTTVSQTHLIAVPDGTGGFFTVYEHNPAGDTDIYAQWVDGAGVRHWGNSGIAVATSGGEQKYPAVTPDGAGGIFIAWQDDFSGNIYAQRINSSGSPLWTSGGVPVCVESGDQLQVKAVSDGSGGVILVWVDKRSGSTSDLYAQRLNASGEAQWTSGGVPVTAASGNQSGHVMVSDGSGGAYIVWDDYRNGFSNIDIYAQKLSASGSAVWTNGGVAVSSANQNQSTVSADTSNGLLIIAWTDTRNDAGDIYAQALNSSGASQWTTGGVPVSAASGTQMSSQIVRDGQGGAILTWADNRSNYDIYAQRLNSAGAAQWNSNGIAVNTADQYQVYPGITPDNAGGAFIVWKDYRSGTEYGLYAQHVDNDGALLWQAAGLAIVEDNVEAGQTHIVISDASGGALTLWQDKRNSQADVYVQLVNDNLDLVNPEADTLWAGGTAHAIRWTERTSDTRFDHLDIRLSSQTGDGYPDIIADNINPSQASFNWTPTSVNTETASLQIWAYDSDDRLLDIYQGQTFRVDSDPPAVFGLTSPANNATVDLVPAFQWQSTTDNLSGFSHYELWIDGARVKDNLSTTQYALTELEALTPGQHTWTVKAVDQADLVRQASETRTLTATQDSDPPTAFGLVAPANGTWTTSAQPELTWQASSDAGTGLEKYQVYVDDELALDNITPTSTSTNQITFANGSHTWRVIAVDSAGNTRTSSQTWTLGVDNTPPLAFSLKKPDDTSWTNDNTPTFQWNGTTDGDVGLAEYELWIDGNLKMDAIGAGATSVTLSGGITLAEGTHTWKILAKDALGNTRTSAETFTVGVDATPPAVFVLSTPANGSLIQTVSPTFEWNASSDSPAGLSRYQLWIDNALSVDNVQMTTTSPPSSLQEGEHTWYIRAVDKAGNKRKSATFSFTADTTAPNGFNLIQPLSNSTVHTSRPTFIWRTMTDAVSGFQKFEFFLNGQKIGGDLSAQDTTITVPNPLENGAYNWKLRAWDNAGNARFSQRIYFNVSTSAPNITSATQVTATEDSPFSYTAAATDPDGDDVTFTFKNYPGWLTPSGSKISGTPLEGTPNTSFRLVASDGELSDSVTVAITIEKDNDPPAITSSAAVTATEDVAFTYTATATDPDGDTISFSFSDLPAWLAPSGNNKVTGTPTEGAQDTSFRVTASDGALQTTQTVQVTVKAVNDPPVITSAAAATATEDVAFTYTATATDPDGDTISFSFSDLPAWLAPSGNNKVTGTPTEGAQDTSFRVTASDGALQTTQTVQVTVTAVNDPPVIRSAAQVTAIEDTPFSYTAEATDPEGDTINFSFTNVPAWLTPNGGTVSGMPIQDTADTSFLVIASDGNLADSLKVSVTVQQVNDPPVITSANTVTATEDILMTYRATATDPDNAQLTLYFLNLPSWLKAYGAEISGKPTDNSQDTTFSVVASDGMDSDTLVVSVTVIPVNDPPVFDRPFPKPVISDIESLHFEINLDDYASDPDNPDSSLAWSHTVIGDAAITVTINQTSHVAQIHGKDLLGDISVAFTVSDPSQASATDTLTLSIIDTGIDDITGTVPDTYVLENNFPNPFNPATTICYGLPRPTHVMLSIYNMLGQNIATLVDKQQNAGRYNVIWNAADVPSGIYFYQIRTENWQQVRRMILMK